MKVLLIEDQPAIAKIAVLLIRSKMDASVEVAETGAEARQMSRQQVYDLVVTDVNLPDGSGYDVVRALREDPRFSGTVMVALSAYGRSEQYEIAREAGCDDYMSKPLDPAKLSEIYHHHAAVTS